MFLFTTKQGTAGPTQITARAETGVRSLARNVDYINSDEYVRYMGEGLAINNGVTDVSATGTDISAYEDIYFNYFKDTFFGEDPNNPGQLANTDWQDFIFDEGVTQKYNVSAAGGNSSTNFPPFRWL
ncbi:MAG: hypothetical protein U5K71_12555 [Gracilimonas sp.]|nr:hypothetical protein [Gracilimonas sp.]